MCAVRSWDYCEQVADEYDVRKYIQFKQNVKKLKWDDDRKLWCVDCDSGKKLYGKFIVNAQGPLSDVTIPKIPAQESFRGDAFHSGQWDHSVKLHNKRVAVVGSGASSVQIVPELQKVVSKLVVFQRTAGWVMPRQDKAVRGWLKWLYENVPITQRFIRGCMYWFREGLILAFKYNAPTKHLYEAISYAILYFSVPDKTLRQKLTPAFRLGCKRVMMSDDWYPAVQKPNVELVTDGIDHIEMDGIVTKDGKKHVVDVIVYATGYAIQRNEHAESAFPIIGSDGMTLQRLWADHMYGYKSSTIPHFPNLIFMLGPNCGLGHNSMILMIESQTQYVADAMKKINDQRIDTIDISEDKCEEYNKMIQHELRNSVWNTGGCASWYLNKDGYNSTVWPGFCFTFDWMMKHFDIENYHITRYDGAAANGAPHKKQL